MFVDIFGGMFGYPIQKPIPFQEYERKIAELKKAKAVAEVSEPRPLKVFLDLYDFPTDGQNIHLENHHELWLTDRRNNFIRSLGSWDPSCFLAKHRMICLDVAFYFIFFWVNFTRGPHC